MIQMLGHISILIRIGIISCKSNQFIAIENIKWSMLYYSTFPQLNRMLIWKIELHILYENGKNR